MMKLTTMIKLVNTINKNWESPIANEIASHWEYNKGTVKEKRASANFVFHFTKSGEDYFLRFNPPGERKFEHIKAEIDFLNYLSDNNIPVAKPVKSLSGKYIETVNTSIGTYYAVVFTALHGKQFEIEDLDKSLFYSWGKSLGELHYASMGYNTKYRLSWKNHIEMVYRILPKEEILAKRELEFITNWVSKLPKNRTNYGLIHFDYELDNLIWKGNDISILDFDDCSFYWFVSDIAFALRDLFDNNVDLDNENFTSFMEGYQTKMSIDKEILKDLSFFLRMHNLITFTKLLRTLEDSNPEEDPKWLLSLRKKLNMVVAKYRKGFATYYD